MQLKHKVAIVTGAANGMGRSVATRFAKEGARVMLADIDIEEAMKSLELIRNEGGTGEFVQTDVSKEDQVQFMIQKTLQFFGRIDILYNNVAVLHAEDRRVHELDSSLFLHLVNVNLNSAFYCCKYTIPEMMKAGAGSIILVGSPTAILGCAPGIAGYSTTKAGVHALARVIAAGYGKDNIRANIIIPGTMDTPMNAAALSSAEAVREFEQATFLGRLGQPSDVDGLAVFLASDESAYCTGAEFTVDGGLTAK